MKEEKIISIKSEDGDNHLKMNSLPRWYYEYAPYGNSKCLFCIRTHAPFLDKEKCDWYLKDKDTYACSIYTAGIPKEILTGDFYPSRDREKHSICPYYKLYKVPIIDKKE